MTDLELESYVYQPKKNRYHATWSSGMKRSMTGTRRALINRLKNAKFIDKFNVHVYACDTNENVLWDNLLHGPEVTDFFSQEEWAEVMGHDDKELKRFHNMYSRILEAT